MHLANTSALEGPVFDPVEPELVASAPVAVPAPALAAEPALAVVDAEALAAPIVATLGLGELPPHPATRAPLRSAAAVSRRARGG